ncbi:MAG: UPF0280 family protein [bacterium]|nr:UPF0280 family protein [bacterium]
MYEKRWYRDLIKVDDLVTFEVVIEETDLLVMATKDLTNEVTKLVLEIRGGVKRYIADDPEFKESLIPYEVRDIAPKIIKEMAEAAKIVGVGPMAAIAGAIAEYVGRGILENANEVIVENGGDIFIKSLRKRKIGIYAGSSCLSNKIAVEIDGKETPLGICTSSGTVGYSLSFGKADAAVVLSQSTALADAAATKIGNLVKQTEDIEPALEFAKTVHGLKGAIIIKDDRMGVWGNIKLV